MKTVVFMKAIRSDLVYTEETDPFVINPYELYALQQLVQMKKQDSSIEITVICMGPVKAEPLLKRCIAMGADQAILVTDRAFAGSDTVATSYILAEAARKLGDVDLMVCGQRAIDGETGQVAYGIAERMKLPVFDHLKKVEQQPDQILYAEQKTAEGLDALQLKAPAMLIFDEFELKRKSISLMALKRAARAVVEQWSAEDLSCDLSMCGFTGSKTCVVSSTESFQKKEKSAVLEDSTECSDLLKKLLKGGQIYGV